MKNPIPVIPQTMQAIALALGVTLHGQESFLGSPSFCFKEEISFGTYCETEVRLDYTGKVWRIVVIISHPSMHRTPSEARMLAHMLERAADLGAFVECVLRGRTWTMDEKGWT